MMLIMVVLVSAFFLYAFRRPTRVPRGAQNAGEVGLDFVRSQIIDEVIGPAGRKYMPYFVTVFFMVLAFNITSILPPFHLPINGVVAVPMFLALTSYLVFNYVGIKEQGLGTYLKGNLFPSGVPPFLYVLVTPIEFVSTFVLRPATLTIRLLANMMAGHLMLALFFSATTYLLFGFLDGRWWTAVFGAGSFLMGFGFTLFEVLVAVLQAYIFALLSAVYVAGALEHH
jgi:F-type H+-transporting ATPase subunit a